MDKTVLEKYVTGGLSTRQIAKEMGKSQSTVKWWLHKHELATSYNRSGERKARRCLSCGETDCTKFYNNRKQTCKMCVNQADTIKKRDKKLAAIKHMGGKCIDCGYDRYYGALEFHHLDKSSKDDWGRFGNWGMKRILKELEKCVLLCATCHRERHGEEDFGWCREGESNSRR